MYIPLHSILQELDDVFVVVSPCDVEGRSKSAQTQLVGKVDDDLHAL